ncbi:DNA polymerase III subunit delta [uncultured Duncaniella sp.]|jgi:DNA polymerase-3 subunit delta|uniref:DNA polymerase III subunit delta n=1 Tax=uncultured Duncaniella sp. TaxID=2768039 RepID=UPI002674466B|nr:DNA polymerase III subunit delta [uncultured Duncaniella sp.]
MATPKTGTSSEITFSQLKKLITERRLAPLYLLHGEEGYYIDELVKVFEELLPEEERDFNLYTIYGPETGVETIMDVCQRLPMMAEHQVVIVKEAQAIRADALNKLHFYAERPNPSTILVIACRGDKAKGKDLIAAIKKNGIVFESKKVTERNLLPVISDLIRDKNMTVAPKALSMLRDYIGTDLSRLYNEIDKLSFILGPGAMITPEAIERNIGISKDYNNFELVDAINSRNAAKAMTIVEYFRNNPKNNPTVMTMSTLFNHFSNLLIYHYTRDKSQSGYMDALGLKSPWALKNYEAAARAYNVRQTIEIISALRECDCRSKGIGSRQNEYDLLKDLMFRILTSQGIIRM